VFQNFNGKPICHDNFKKRNFDNDCAGAGVPPLRFYDLRHTAATLMISMGIEATTVKEILGHRSIETTMIYVHLLADTIQVQHG